MIIGADTNQFAKGSHFNSNFKKHKKIEALGHKILQLPLPVADYVLVNDEIQEVVDRATKRGISVKKMDLLGTYNIAVDTKKSLVEVAGNLCSKNHDRITDDLRRAKKHNINVFWLIENTEGITCIEDLFKRGKTPVTEHGWKQTKNGLKWVVRHKTQVKCISLAKTLYTMEHREEYNIKFLFCKPEEAGQMIVELLTGGSKTDV